MGTESRRSEAGHRVSGRSRHPRTRLHNTSVCAVAVRWTLIIYLLQFRLFSSIFHISSPHTPLFTHCRTAAEKTLHACVRYVTVYSQKCIVALQTSHPPRRARKHGRSSINKTINISQVMNRKIGVIKNTLLMQLSL